MWIRTAISTRSRSSLLPRELWSLRRSFARAEPATARRCGSRAVTPAAFVSGAIEGAGHYGAGLARYLAERGETALEVGRHARGERRLRGKDDPLDAIRAARAGLAAETLTLPRAGQRQEALRVLLLARRSAVDVRRVALVQLRSVIVTAPEQLRDELRRLPLAQLIRRCSRFRRSHSRTPDELAVVLALRSLARRIEAATEEPTSSSARSATTYGPSRPACSTSPASARSSRRN